MTLKIKPGENKSIRENKFENYSLEMQKTMKLDHGLNIKEDDDVKEKVSDLDLVDGEEGAAMSATLPKKCPRLIE